MKYLIAKPTADRVTITVEDLPSKEHACQAVGLAYIRTDGAIVYFQHRHRPGLDTGEGELVGVSILVSEYGLFDAKAPLMLAGGRLYAGPAVFYQFVEGEDVDFDLSDPMTDLGIAPISKARAEELMILGHLARPQITLGGRVIWQWPQPRPDIEQHIVDHAEAMAAERKARHRGKHSR